MSKVIFDTNIWVSYFIQSKQPDLVDLVIDNDLVIYSSKELVSELEEVLGREKFRKYLQLPIAEYIDFHVDLTTLVHIDLTFKGSPDPKDDYLFDLAIHTGGAIITGDKKLLMVSPLNGVKLLSLAAFKASL